MKKHLVDWFGMCLLVTVSSALRVPCQGKPHICSRKWLRQTQRNCCTIAFVPWMFGVNWKACNSLPLTFGLDRPLSFMIKPLIAILPQLLMFQGCMLMPAWNQCPIIIRNRIPAAMFWGQTEAEAAPLVCQNDSSQPIQTGSFLLDSRSLKFQDKALCAWIELWGTSQVQSLLQWRPDFKKNIRKRCQQEHSFFGNEGSKRWNFQAPKRSIKLCKSFFLLASPVLISGHLNLPLRLPLARTRSRVREHCLNWCFSRAAMQRGRAQHTTRASARQK